MSLAYQIHSVRYVVHTLNLLNFLGRNICFKSFPISSSFNKW